MTQLSMTGEDWLSDRDRKSQARVDAARKRAALTCAAKLTAAAEALSAYLHACRECRDNSGDELRGISDGRHRLIADCMEYACYLDSVYEK